MNFHGNPSNSGEDIVGAKTKRRDELKTKEKITDVETCTFLINRKQGPKLFFVAPEQTLLGFLGEYHDLE